MITIKRRIGGGGAGASGGRGSCPDFFELEDGDYILIGRDVTTEMRGRLPTDAICGDDERIVLLPRKIILSAKKDI